MTDVTAEERRALWLDVARWPLSGGMLGGVILLAAMAYASAQCEGGATESQRETRAMLLWMLMAPAVFAALGHYAWRAVACTYPSERPVPWFGDPDDDAPLGRRVQSFAAVVVVSFAPLLAWTTLHGPLGAPVWVHAVVLAALAAVGAALLPLGLAATVVAGNPTAAMPGTVSRMWKAEPRAARIAAVTALVFVGLLLLSGWVGTTSARPSDAGMAAAADAASHPDKDPVGDVARGLIFVLRAAGFYAALASFRVAGLLVREVPAVREAVR
jgi:hypothetical protein